MQVLLRAKDWAASDEDLKNELLGELGKLLRVRFKELLLAAMRNDDLLDDLVKALALEVRSSNIVRADSQQQQQLLVVDDAILDRPTQMLDPLVKLSIASLKGNEYFDKDGLPVCIA